MYDAPAPEALAELAEPLVLLDDPGVVLVPVVPAAPGDVVAPGVAAPDEVIAFISMNRSADALADPAAGAVEPGVLLPVVPTAALLPWRHPVTLIVFAVLVA